MAHDSNDFLLEQSGVTQHEPPSLPPQLSVRATTLPRGGTSDCQNQAPEGTHGKERNRKGKTDRFDSEGMENVFTCLLKMHSQKKQS